MTVSQLLALFGAFVGMVAMNDVWWYFRTKRFAGGIIILIIVAISTIVAGYLAPKTPAQIFIGFVMVSGMLTLIFKELSSEACLRIAAKNNE